MNNICDFSMCRKYRYTLEHRWDEILGAPIRRIQWIGLNPSTADEQNLDPTLRRIKSFSTSWGYNAFTMTNLFAYRATQPKDMKVQIDPVGADNDFYLERVAATSDLIIAAWGTHGDFLHRADQLTGMLIRLGHRHKIRCLEVNADGSPKHPLYVKGDTKPLKFAA